MKPTPKTKIYNVVILDQSGSMDRIKSGTISGFNEVLSGIVEAQQKFADTQEHFVSLTVFNSKVSYVHNKVEVKAVARLTDATYRPSGSTALYDAMGQTLLNLEAHLDNEEDAVAIVTIITDGEENASRKFTGSQIYSIVERLKEKGWTFAFMGANQDVMAVAKHLNIDHARAFDYTDDGMCTGARADRNAKMRIFEEFNGIHCFTSGLSKEERQRYRRDQAKSNKYFDDEPQHSTNLSSSFPAANRITPDWIDSLAPNEVFVFGSNVAGNHNGGAAQLAFNRFGAVMGQAEGPQGQSYAIPVDGVNIKEFFDAVERFIDYAKQHPHQTFLVLPIGCGIVRANPKLVAQFFSDAIDVPNIKLPQIFWSQY